MKTLVGIRTYRWGEEEERLYQALAPVCGDDLVAVVQNPAADLDVPLDVVPLTDDWLDDQGLRRVSNWGWRCGDYAYYAMRQAMPDYDMYWLVEPDVFFSSDPAPFFDAFKTDKTDLLGIDITEFGEDHRFARGMPDLPLYRAIFALTRISGTALDKLVEWRKAERDSNVLRRDYPNDEVFVFSNIIADPDLTTGNLRERAPVWFKDSVFRTDPDLLIDQLVAGDALPGRVYHPARSLTNFRGALAARISARVGFLKPMRKTIALFEDDDIEDVVRIASGNIRRHLRAARRAGLKIAKDQE